MFNQRTIMNNFPVRFRPKAVFILLFSSLLFNVIAVKAQGISYTLKRDKSVSESLINKIENVDPYTGNLNFNLPLVATEGRGSTAASLSLGIVANWTTRTEYGWEPVGNPGNGDEYVAHHIPLINDLWTGYSFGPGKVFFESGRSYNNGIFLKLIYATQDGRQIELVDTLTNANPAFINCPTSTYCLLGKEFASVDGSGITFLSDTDIYKGTIPSDPVEEYPNAIPTGFLLFPNGTRMRVEEGLINSSVDVNGNQTTFEYQPPSTSYYSRKLIKIKDSLHREINIQYSVDEPQPYGQCDKIIFNGFGGEYKTIRIAFRKLVSDSLLRNGLQPKTLRQLFPLDQSPLFFRPGLPNGGLTELGVWTVNDEIFDPYRAASVWTSDGKAYKFRYDNYGSLARVELPTGVAIEYDWTASTRNYLSNVGINDVSVFSIGGVSISRRVIEKRLYKDTNNLYEKVTYSRPGSCTTFDPQYYSCLNPNTEDFDEVNYKSSTDALKSRERHYYYGLGSISAPYTAIYGYDNWHLGKEYKSEYFADDGTTLLKRTLTSFKNKTVAWVSNQDTAPPYDARVSEVAVIDFENGKALGILKRNEFDENGDANPTYFSHLNVKKAKTYNYKVLNLTTAQNADMATISAMFNENDLVSVTESDYLYNEGYRVRHILGTPSETRIMNPASPTQALSKNQIIYDEQSQYYSMVDYGSTIGYTAPTGTYAHLRGNATTYRTWFAEENRWLETHTQYDNFGNARKVWDSSGDQNRFVETEYSSQDYYAYPTTTTAKAPDPTGTHGTDQISTVSTAYDFWTGRATSVTDANGQVTSMEYDALGRPKKMIPPAGGGIVEKEYGDTPGSIFIKTRSQVDAQNWAETTAFLDNLGRVYKSQTKDIQGDIFSEVEYDIFGRIERVSNPYRQGEQKYWSKPRYDNAGRMVETYAPAPDGQTGASLGIVEFGISTIPGLIGNYVTVTDASGRMARSITNIYGQVVRVDEPTGNNELGSLENPNQSSYYTYNVKGELVKILQGNENQNCQTAQCRFFKYDSLGRLILVKQPEQIPHASLATTGNPENNQWTSGFTYDVFGNVTTVTDAKGMTITNTYDKAGRVTNSSYSDGLTPAVEYFYDGTGLGLLQVPQFAKGNLTKSTNGVSATKYTSFDNYGRVLTNQQITDGQTYNFAYKYDSTGNLTEETYPSLRVVKTHLDTDGGLSAVSSKTANSPYKNYASNFSYTATGNIKAMMLGNGRWETAVFNERHQATQVGLGSTATDTSLWKVNYDYGELNTDGSVNASKNIGMVAKQTITLPTTAFVQTYKYDALNRLVEAKENANTTSGTENWTQTFGYDRYGNRTGFYQKLGSTVLTIDNKTKPQIDSATNRFTTGQGYVYDFNGNLVQDANNRGFTYNGDDKQTVVRDLNIPTTPQNPEANVIGKYYYDGEGRRVKKVTSLETTIFVYDAGGALVAEYSTQSNPEPTISYLTTDNLGSPRVVTDKQGNVTARRDFMPFGEELLAGVGSRDVNMKYSTSGIDNIRQRFTGYEKDIESELDFAEARMYKNQHGRFTSPDPLFSSASLANPQTFNRYSYTGNNPVNLIDPSGLKWCRTKDGVSYTNDGSCGGEDIDNTNQVIVKGSVRTIGGYDAQVGDEVKLNDNGTATLVRVGPENLAAQVTVQAEQTVQAQITGLNEVSGEEALAATRRTVNGIVSAYNEDAWGLPELSTEQNSTGRAAGHGLAFAHGVTETAAGIGTIIAGAGGEAVGGILDLSGIGIPVGVTVAVASAAAIAGGAALTVHGTSVAATGFHQLFNDNLSGKNPPMNEPRQTQHVDGTPGKSQFDPNVDHEKITKTGWEMGKPYFDKNGKIRGKTFTFKDPIGTRNGKPTNTVEVRFSKKKGIHGFPSKP